MRLIGSGLGGRVALALMFFVCAATAPSLASAQSRHADATRQGMGHVDAFSTGYNHSCGVRDDGSAACWGDNSLGQTAAPAGRFLQIAVGGWHNCGLRSDGTATCWGNTVTASSPRRRARSPSSPPAAGSAAACARTARWPAGATPATGRPRRPPALLSRSAPVTATRARSATTALRFAGA